jgi:carboxymethylenebutenolidase
VCITGGSAGGHLTALHALTAQDRLWQDGFEDVDTTVAAAVPFYGGQPDPAAVPKIKAPLLIHYAEHDERINAGWPAYETALKAAGVHYEMHMYPGTQHGFNNDTTPRYDEKAAALAWQRTVDFFRKHVA